MLMEQILFYVVLGVLGLVMGSFAGATVWRLRAQQLIRDKADGEEVNKKEYEQLTPLTKGSLADDRSRCLDCGHTLAWYDLIPLVSWLSTKGKCRYCKSPIGWFEPLMEMGTALLFVLSYAFWPEVIGAPLETFRFILWLVACVLLVILFAYDLRWYLLPNKVVFPLMAVGGVMALIGIFSAVDPVMKLVSLASAVLILSGIYFMLWLFSKGTWIGFGDVKLGLALALILGEWHLAFVALFAANVIGCLIVLPGMLGGKVSRKTRIPFGPLLILGSIIALLWGQIVVGWYFFTLT